MTPHYSIKLRSFALLILLFFFLMHSQYFKDLLFGLRELKAIMMTDLRYNFSVRLLKYLLWYLIYT